MSARIYSRNIHIYSAQDTETPFGGLVLTNGMTNTNLYSMAEIVFIFDKDYTLYDENENTLTGNDIPLTARKYFILTEGSITVNNEPWLARSIAISIRANTMAFRDSVRERDFGCVITGTPALSGSYRFWQGFDATHMFSVAYQEHWTNHNHDRWITIPGPGGSINSV